jgi:hypothetical protein
MVDTLFLSDGDILSVRGIVNALFHCDSDSAMNSEGWWDYTRAYGLGLIRSSPRYAVKMVLGR